MLAMSVRALLTASLLALPAVASAQVQSYSEVWNGRKAARSDDLFKTTMMDAHNRARALYGSPPLAWNDGLVASARAYAQRLARENRFAHDMQSGVRVRQGENLWMGTREAFPYTQMADSWVEERKYYKSGRFPDVSRTGNWAMVGHYTQIVWPRTTSVGCAMASNARDEFLVCRYLPAGNVMGVAMK